jgi:hypothetical protein
MASIVPSVDPLSAIMISSARLRIEFIDAFIQGASFFTLTITLIPVGLFEGLGVKPNSGTKLKTVRRQFRNLFFLSGHWFALILWEAGRLVRSW